MGIGWLSKSMPLARVLVVSARDALTAAKLTPSAGTDVPAMSYTHGAACGRTERHAGIVVWRRALASL
jgi:hypothetical protein